MVHAYLSAPHRTSTTDPQETLTIMHSSLIKTILSATTLIAISLLFSLNAKAADPGAAYPATSEASDTKAGSLLIYNYFNSDSSNASARNTTINLTNTHPTRSVIVHFFFVTSLCSVADFKAKLTQNQTYSFDVADIDPDIAGYIMVLAENSDGVPITHNALIGDAYIRDDFKSVNLSAVSFSADWGVIGTALPSYVNTSPTADVQFSGVSGGYNRLPMAVALSSLPSRAAGDRTMLILNSIGGSYLTSAGVGTGAIFGILYDDAERSASFSLSFSCQYARILDDNTPRTVPRYSTFVPAGRTGWMRLYSQDGTTALMGAMMVWNIIPSGARQGAHNLHHLTLSSTPVVMTMPVFPF
jgi:hypothetical protein